MTVASILKRALVGTAALVLLGAGLLASDEAASAAPAERDLTLTHADGTLFGALFDAVTIVPGGSLSTTVYAHRVGGGSSELSVSLKALNVQAGADPFETAAVLTVTTPTTNGSAPVVDLLGEGTIELGRSSEPDLPLTVTLTLPYSAENDTQIQALDFQLVVTATDVDDAAPETDDPSAEPVADPSNPLGALPHTGVTLGSAIVAALALGSAGLLLLGAKRRRRDDGRAS